MDQSPSITDMVAKIELLSGYAQHQSSYIDLLHKVTRLAASLCNAGDWDTFMQLKFELTSALNDVSQFKIAYGLDELTDL